MKFVLVLHPARPIALAAGQAIVDACSGRGIEVLTAPSDVSRLPGTTAWHVDGPTDADIVIAVGGDGTMLEAARLARPSGTPLIGVNAGTVGFLTEVPPDQVAAMVERSEASDYTISERMTLRATLPDGTQFDALNDVVTEKAMIQRVVGISLSIGGTRLVAYRADAVITATPTGSTAYTLSAGGPLVDPTVDAIVVTPVAAHNLVARSMVLAPSTILDIEIVGDRVAAVHADGQSQGTLQPGEMLRIERGPHRDRLVRLVPDTFASTIGEAMWSRNAR